MAAYDNETVALSQYRAAMANRTNGKAIFDVVNNGQQYVDVTITSAQVLALNATEQTIVAAPGANKALVFEGAMVRKPAGTAYAGVAAGEDFSIKYTDSSGAEVAQIETTGFMDQTTNQIRWAYNNGTEETPVENSPLVLHLLVGEITTGDSPLHLRVFFRTVKTDLG